MGEARVRVQIEEAFAAHEQRDDDRFEKLREGQRELMERFRDVAETVDELEREVGGAPKVGLRNPDRPTLRDRVHYLESSAQAATIAQAALDQARDTARSAWTRREKFIAGSFAAIAALSSVLRLIGVGG
jgi:hypothetical protein